MKRLSVFIIALAISLGVNAQSYQNLWKEYEDNVKNLLPTSAGNTLDKIEKQAKKDKNDIQLLKIAFKRCDLMQIQGEYTNDSIISFCENYLPKLSQASQMLLKVEMGKAKYDFSFMDEADIEFTKSISMERYEPVYDDFSNYSLKLEPTLFDYVMHCAIDFYRYRSDKDKLAGYYQRLLDFDLENNYTEAYYNNRLEQLGSILNDEQYEKHSQLADECPDKEMKAKIKIQQIIYLRRANQYGKALQLCEETMTLLDGKNPMYQQCVNFKESILKKTVDVEMQYVQLPNRHMAAALTYRNTTNPSYRIYRLTPKQFEQTKYIQKEDVFKMLKNSKIVEEATISTPEETDYGKHSSLIALPPMDLGQYVLVFSPDTKFDNVDDIAILPFQVSNLSYMQLSTDQGLVLYILNRDTSEPIEGVKAECYTNNYIYQLKDYERQVMATEVSDSQGMILLNEKFNKYFSIDLSYQDDVLIASEWASYWGLRTDTKTKIRSYFYTDRAIYRPGQTVRFKGIFTQYNDLGRELLPDYKTTVELRDANSQIIDTLTLTTDEFGSVSGSFVIPKNLMKGTYRIYNKHCNLATFQVEEYKRPTFEVAFNTPEKESKIGDSVSITGTVAALSGFGLDNVSYQYTVSRNVLFPFRFFSYYAGSEIIVSGKGVTSAEGKFSIDFPMLPDSEIAVNRVPKYTYTVKVTATNAQGESQTETYNLFATYNLYDIQIHNGRSETVDVSDLKNLSVSITTVYDVPVDRQINCKIFKIKEPNKLVKNFERIGNFDRQLLDEAKLEEYFPDYVYNVKETEEKTLVREFVTNVNGKARLLPDKMKLEPGRYIFELNAVDDSLSGCTKTLSICNFKTQKMPFRAMYWTYLDKETAQPGETVNFYVGTSMKDVSVLVVALVGDKIRKSERVKLSNSVHKFSYKLTENDRGRVYFQMAFEKQNTECRYMANTEVPYDNMKLDITLHTERKKFLPGETETWSVTVKDYKNNPAAASLMAGMYDASLDFFATDSWALNVIPLYKSGSPIMSDKSFHYHYNGVFHDIARFYLENPRLLSQANMLSSHKFRGYGAKFAANYAIDGVLEEEVVEYTQEKSAVVEDTEEYLYFNVDEDGSQPQTGSNAKPAKIRENFDETAFFYPDLTTDKAGDVTFTFTMPDALTRWKLRMLAYTKSLAVGTYEQTFVTQQPLMIMADMPRFAYDEDTLWLAANVINLSDDDIAPQAKLEIVDADNNPVDLFVSEQIINMEAIPAGRSGSVRWKVAMQKDLGVLNLRFSVITLDFSDAEQHRLPVLSTDIFLTQTYSLTVEANSSLYNEFDMNKEGERNHDIKLNVNANPMFYALQALPYLAEGEQKYTLTEFNRYFVNSMARQIVKNNPNIEKMFEGHEGDTLSELQKNDDLKAILLQETPWVLEAKNEARQRANIAKIFDTASINANITSALDVLAKKQTVNGGWPWIEGMPESEFITQYILCGMGRLDKRGLITKKAFSYIENELIERYNRLDTDKKKKQFQCGYATVKDLLALSYFNYKSDSKFAKAKSFYMDKLMTDWKSFSFENQAAIALIFYRNGNHKKASLIIQSLRERAVMKDNMMYWRNTGIESEARILEAFNEIDQRTGEIDAMRLWILTQKRTNMWENDRATVEAVFALTNRGTDWNDENVNTSFLKNNDFVKIRIDNPTDHVVWGGLYRQYFVPIDKVQQHNDAMKIKRELFVERVVDNKLKYIPIAEQDIKVGDKVKVEITFENSQDMEFVYLKDLRGACFEPTEQLSRYHWSDDMWYYQSTSDVAMEYFFENLPKGKHKVSHTMYVTKYGNFSSGYSHIQCQYAPEFGAYSNGSRISVAL